MDKEDIRWKQRFASYIKALKLVEEALELSVHRNLTDLEKQGLIQMFEFTHELAWNVLKDYLEYQGSYNIIGSRDATREAFNKGLVEDGEVWMEMIKSRNKSSHTYDEDILNELEHQVLHLYFPAFVSLRNKINSFL